MTETDTLKQHRTKALIDTHHSHFCYNATVSFL